MNDDPFQKPILLLDLLKEREDIREALTAPG
jgi:hypothetical protein